MIPGFVLVNLQPWLVQVLLVATAGALLPLLFRIRHPRSQLAYCHAVLGLCFALPMIQPWQDSIAIVTGYSFNIVPTETGSLPWGTVIVWILLSGALAKLGWLGIGLFQIRHYRKRALPLVPVPDSIREARRITTSDARFCISPNVSGPATVGHIDPIVLLPESFQSLDQDSQRSIACHELLHVRRRDWLVTVIEEIAGALLWFNPGVWWLLAQAKLSREQMVDAEVVKLTAPEPYIAALLSMALVAKKRWALPAASFLTEGHLIHRMRLLLAGPDRSIQRLCLRYVSAAFLLTSIVWSGFIWFPLQDEPHVVFAAPTQTHQVLVWATDPSRQVRIPGVPQEFSIAVPPPRSGKADVLYFVHEIAPGGTLRSEDVVNTFRLPPPPPPPPGPGPFGFLAARGIRMVRPGEIPTPEEIQRLRDALGDRTEVEIDQAEDGTVRRISVHARRLSNEADFIRSVVPAPATEPSGSDRVD